MHLGLDELNSMLPEETNALVKAGRKILDSEADERWSHTKLIVRAAASGLKLR